MGASPDALCLYQTWFSEAIWFGLDWESLGSTLSAPLLWGIRFLLPLLAVFCFVPLRPSFPLSISDCGNSALVNCWTHIQHGMAWINTLNHTIFFYIDLEFWSGARQLL
ncbi:hypothetical protein PVAP13_7KG144855 [Panicum virgatum]|uniref:Uncharacterized protein n=1 Tax=Panicum virgatum TaxID=38727 RepID=A0A8T0QDI6_PANVG|nr:hypothetical protein PVAP13_7KG144855 [Panicum virgatum]